MTPPRAKDASPRPVDAKLEWRPDRSPYRCRRCGTVYWACDMIDYPGRGKVPRYDNNYTANMRCKTEIRVNGALEVCDQLIGEEDRCYQNLDGVLVRYSGIEQDGMVEVMPGVKMDAEAYEELKNDVVASRRDKQVREAIGEALKRDVPDEVPAA